MSTIATARDLRPRAPKGEEPLGLEPSGSGGVFPGRGETGP